MRLTNDLRWVTTQWRFFCEARELDTGHIGHCHVRFSEDADSAFPELSEKPASLS